VKALGLVVTAVEVKEMRVVATRVDMMGAVVVGPVATGAVATVARTEGCTRSQCCMRSQTALWGAGT